MASGVYAYVSMNKYFAFFIAVAAFAQDPEYLPLRPGNQWIYQASLGEPLTVEVTRLETIAGNNYAIVRGLHGTGETPLRQQGNLLLVYDRAARQEKTYLDFSQPLDRNFPSAAHACNPTAAIADRDAKEKLPLGDFSGMIAVRYNIAGCADAGLTQDLFLPYIGLMRRTETSFTGPRHYDLVYARINGFIQVAVPETGFAVHAALVPRGWLVRMTLRHTGKLDFSSSQTFDIRVKNDKDETVYVWSADKSFLAALQTIEVNGEKNWATVIPGANRVGRYTVEAWLTTMGSQPFKASTALVVEVGIGASQ